MFTLPVPSLVPVPSANPITYVTSAASGSKQVPSPLGQPFFLIRLGLAESDKESYFGGISYEVPVTPLGIHVVSVRGDLDIWEHFSGTSGGGFSGAVIGTFGPDSSYVGAGIDYAARINHASGPTGPGIKLVLGGRPIPVIGYELGAIVANRGAVGMAAITLHF